MTNYLLGVLTPLALLFVYAVVHDVRCEIAARRRRRRRTEMFARLRQKEQR